MGASGEQFDRWRDSSLLLPPSFDQLIEFRQTLTDIVRAQGKGVRIARLGEIATTRLGTEYMIPGAYTEFSPQSKSDKGYPRTERMRRISASFRPSLGSLAGRMTVRDSEDVYLSDIDSYLARRRSYRFEWDKSGQVTLSEVLPVDIVSDARVDGEAEIRVDENGPKAYLIADHHRTVSGLNPDKTSGYHSDINPFRQQDSPWDYATETDVDVLLSRADEYGRDMINYFEKISK